MNCKICDRPFEAKSHRQLICSVACSRENRKKISLESYYRTKGEPIPNRKRKYNPDVPRLTGKEQKDKYRQNNKEKIKERSKLYNLKSFDTRKNYHLQKHFNLTLQDYNQMLEAQNNCCAICYKHADYFAKKLAVDHCHNTNKIRGLLCDTCNRSLGMFQDSTEILQNAIDYLNKSKG